VPRYYPGDMVVPHRAALALVPAHIGKLVCMVDKTKKSYPTSWMSRGIRQLGDLVLGHVPNDIPVAIIFLLPTSQIEFLASD